MTASNLTPTNERWLLFAAILASSMAFIDSTALGVALPAIQSDLRMDGAQALWASNAYTLMLAALILVGGSLGDHLGRKRVFMIGIGLFAGASLLCGLAPSVELLIAARALQGIGSALMTPGSLALISALVAPERRGAAIGTWSTFSTLTTLGGPFLGGLLAGAGLWRLIFFINLPLALIALALLNRGVPESRDEVSARRLDYPGAALATIGLAGITYGFTELPALGLSNPVILIPLASGLAALALFVIVQARSPHPMIPLRLFRSRTFSGANALTLFLYAALGAVPFFLNFNLIRMQNYPENVVGLTFLPLGILLALLSRRMGALVDRIGPRPLLTIGPAVAGVGFALFALPGLTGGPGDYWTTYFPATVILGIGMGITVAPLTTAVLGAAPREASGIASGINNAAARTASVLAIAILGAVALTHFSQSIEARLPDLNLSAEQADALRAETSRLADAAPPPGLDAAAEAETRLAIQWAYVEMFRLIALIGAALAWIGALLAWALVQPKARGTPATTG